MLVEGVTAHRERIDQLLAEHAEGWTVARMPAVDRTLLRIGVFELLWVDEIDDPVAITEAVELARTLSTDDSPALPQRGARPDLRHRRAPPRGALSAPAAGPFSGQRRPRQPRAGRQHAPAR